MKCARQIVFLYDQLQDALKFKTLRQTLQDPGFQTFQQLAPSLQDAPPVYEPPKMEEKAAHVNSSCTIFLQFNKVQLLK